MDLDVSMGVGFDAGFGFGDGFSDGFGDAGNWFEFGDDAGNRFGDVDAVNHFGNMDAGNSFVGPSNGLGGGELQLQTNSTATMPGQGYALRGLEREPDESGVDFACRLLDIPQTLKSQASFESRHGELTALPAMASNHAAIVMVLTILGLDPKNPRSRVSFDGGLVLLCQEVVHHFGWSSATYNKRLRLYRAAAAIARCQWPNSATDNPLRSIWVDVKRIWGQGHPIQVNPYPPISLSERQLVANCAALQQILGLF
ncbi:hypothetical protein OH77DRAFT_1515596 [Trametes cingulata]|nr:hypothetical protein OH77DRAFT_1515596 [Trametes cingulata]